MKKLSSDGSERIVECVGVDGDLTKFAHPMVKTKYDWKGNVISNATPNDRTYKHIWTNNFWPMDDSPTWGADGHDMKFGDQSTPSKKENRRLYDASTTGSQTFPWSDDDEDHNAFFGMHFDMKFKIPEDYIGTLDFAFFGDDDVWVFLDGKLILDIGGIHSAMGEYVDLWDHIKNGDASEHTLSFFYMERGASGSTCWMRLTLPDAEFADILEDNEKELEKSFGQLEIRKEVDAGTGTPSGDEYSFGIELTGEAGGPVKGECGYAITRGLEKISEGVIRSKDGNGGTEIAEYRNGELVPLEGGKFRLGDQDSILISNIPAGTRYTVREDEDPGKYSTTVTDGQGTVPGNEASGSIEKRPDTGDGEDAPKGIDTVRLTYVNSLAPAEGSPVELPKTGGTGTAGFYIAGGTLAAVAWACLAVKRRRRWARRNFETAGACPSSFHPRQAAGISATGMTGMEEGAGHGPATCMAIPRRERRQCHSLRGIFSCQPVWRFLFEYGSAYERGPSPARGYPRCPAPRGEGTYRWASTSCSGRC